MDNQHQKISGYRDLSQEEIDLINRIKAFGSELEKLITDIDEHIDNQYEYAHRNLPTNELQRLTDADPVGWLFSGKTDLQVGLMKLTRSVAQPTIF